MINVVVSYDITDDRRRNRMARVLKDYGSRVQYSVFEAVVNEEQLEELMERVEELLDNDEDSVRYYLICASCLKKVRVQGREDKPFHEEDFIIV